MRNTITITLSLRKEVNEMLIKYAKLTRQSKSRAVSELVRQAISERDDFANEYETKEKIKQS